MAARKDPVTGLTEKQEKFCQKYIELGNASEAYRQSYDASRMPPTSIHVKANEVLNNVNVTLRIGELRAIHQERHMVTVDSLTDELEEARGLALTTEQPSAAVSATMGKAKLHGLLVDSVKTELTGKDGKPIEWREVSDSELNARITELTVKV